MLHLHDAFPAPPLRLGVSSSSSSFCLRASHPPPLSSLFPCQAQCGFSLPLPLIPGRGLLPLAHVELVALLILSLVLVGGPFSKWEQPRHLRSLSTPFDSQQTPLFVPHLSPPLPPRCPDSGAEVGWEIPRFTTPFQPGGCSTLF